MRVQVRSHRPGSGTRRGRIWGLRRRPGPRGSGRGRADVGLRAGCLGEAKSRPCSPTFGRGQARGLAGCRRLHGAGGSGRQGTSPEDGGLARGPARSWCGKQPGGGCRAAATTQAAAEGTVRTVGAGGARVSSPTARPDGADVGPAPHAYWARPLAIKRDLASSVKRSLARPDRLKPGSSHCL